MKYRKLPGRIHQWHNHPWCPEWPTDEFLEHEGSQKKTTFARTAHQSLNSNPKTLRQREKTDNNRREPQRPLLDGSYARKLNCRLRGCRTICIFLFRNAGVLFRLGPCLSYATIHAKSCLSVYLPGALIDGIFLAPPI